MQEPSPQPNQVKVTAKEEMKDSAHHSTSSKKNRSSFLSDDSGTNTSRFSFLNTSQEEYVKRQVSRETELLDDGDDPPLHNERPSKKKKDDVWHRKGGGQHDVDASLRKVHEPESIFTSDFGLEPPKMSRNYSNGTPIPPPPTNRSKPGAVSVPGFHQSELPTESTSRSSEQPTGKPFAPILQASVVVDQEETSSPIAPAASLPVYAEAMKEVDDDESSNKRSCCVVLKDRRLLTILVIMVITIVSFAVGISIVLANNKETITTTTVEYIPATPVPTPLTMAPSPSPTVVQPTPPPQEFLPPSPAQCQQIESGNSVENQDQMIRKTYHVELDVVVEPSVSGNLDHHFALLVDRMQDTLAPKLAQCDTLNNQRRRRRRTRKLVRGGDTKRQRQYHQRNLVAVSDYLVANAQFSHAALPSTNLSCKAGTPQPCYKVIKTIDLYIKEDELDVRLISLIMDAFDAESLVQLLDLVFPFKSIAMIGVTSNTPADDATNTNDNIFDSPDDDEDED